MSTARWRGGKRCKEVMNASLILSLIEYLASGLDSSGAGTSKGYGSSQTGSLMDGGMGCSSVDSASRAMGRLRRGRLRSESIHRLVAILYSQVRNVERPSYVS